MSQSFRKRLIWNLLGQRKKHLTAEQRARMLYRRRVLNRRILATVLGFSLVMGIFAAALFLRLSAGPLDLQFADSIVRPGLQRLLGEDGTADFSRLELEWVKGRLRVRVADFSVNRPDGQLIAKAPGAYIGFSVFSLLSGKIEPSTLEITRPVIALTIAADGSAALGGEQASAGADKTTVPVLGLLEPQFISRLLPYGQYMFGRGALRFLRLEDVTVNVTDDRWGITRQFDPFTVDLEQTLTQSVAVEITAPDSRGGWQILLDLGREKDGARNVKLETKHLALASLIPSGSGITVSDTNVNAKLSTRISEEGLLTPLTGEITLDGGRIQGEDIDAVFNPLILKAQLETDARTLIVSPALFSIGGIDGVFSGRVLFPAAGDPTRPVRLDLRADNLSFENGKRFPEVNAVSLAAAYELSNHTLWIDYLRAGAQETVVNLKGTVRFVGKTPELKLVCDVGAMSAEAAKALWPSIVAPPVRQWVRENTEGGRIEKGTINAAIPSGWLQKDDRPLLRQFISTQWDVKDISVKLTPELPVAHGLSAHIEATGRSARVDAQGGKINLPSGAIDVPNGTFIAPDFSPKKSFGRLNLLLVGSLRSMTELAEKNDYKLGNEDGSGFDVSKLSGEALANIEVQVPIWKSAKVADAKTTVDAELRNVSGQDIFEGRDLKNGAFEVKVEGGAMHAEGSASIDDIPSKIFMNRDSAGRTVLKAEVEADDSLRQKLGINLDPWVTGTTVIRRVEDFSDATPERIEVDLTAAKFAIPQLLFEKPAGQPATLSFNPKGDKRISELEDVNIQGKSWVMRGRIHLNDKGAADLVEFNDIKLRPDDSFAARIERAGNVMQAQVSGRSIDLRPFLAQLLSSNEFERCRANGHRRACR